MISTQVLEHVPEPEVYFAECLRILKPGGQLILFTHGMFEEHGAPFDFHRWTCNGLEALARRTGFWVEESGKVTTEIRALIQLLNQLCLHLKHPSSRITHIILAAFRKGYFHVLMPILHLLAGRFNAQALVSAADPASLYVSIVLRARRP